MVWKFFAGAGAGLIALTIAADVAGAETLDCTFTDFRDPTYSQDLIKKMVPARQRHIIKGNVVRAGTLTGKVTQNTKSRLKWVVDWSNVKAEAGTIFHYKFTFFRKTGMILLHIDLQGDYKPIERVAGKCVSRS